MSAHQKVNLPPADLSLEEYELSLLTGLQVAVEIYKHKGAPQALYQPLLDQIAAISLRWTNDITTAAQ